MVLLITNDLMMGSNASSHARENNVELVQANHVDKALETIREHRPMLMIVDLQMPGLEIEQLGEEISNLPDSVRPLTVAYAQHVETERIARAQASGFDQVLTRGQINGQMGRLIAGAK